MGLLVFTVLRSARLLEKELQRPVAVKTGTQNPVKPVLANWSSTRCWSREPGEATVVHFFLQGL